MEGPLQDQQKNLKNHKKTLKSMRHYSLPNVVHHENSMHEPDIISEDWNWNLILLPKVVPPEQSSL